MGVIWTKLKNMFWKPHKVLLIGIDDVGKTTILYKLKLRTVVKTVPTIGFNVQSLNYKNVTIECWDFGFRQNMIPFLRYYFEDGYLIIFVIDASCDGERYKEQIQLFNTIQDYKGFKGTGIPVLILANKADLGTRTKSEIIEDFGVDRLEGPWLVQECVAIEQRPEGLFLGLQWVCNQLQS